MTKGKTNGTLYPLLEFFERKKGAEMISTETLQLIAKKFGTPAYVYEQAMFRKQLLALANAILWRPLGILFAIKANENFRVLRTLVRQPLPKGVYFGVDAVSPGEVLLALRGGVPHQNIMFTGNNAPKQDVVVAQKNRIFCNIDSLPRLEWFCRMYPESEVCVRINPDVGAGHHDHCITGGPESKFGIWFSEAKKALDIADRHGVKIVGVHQHIGSQILDPGKFLEAMEMMFRVAPIFPDLRSVDFGGGFGVPYNQEKPLDIQDLGKEMSLRFEQFCKQYKRKLALVIEPGRYLTAEAGYLLVQVTDVKENPDGRVFVGVDSGFCHLDRPARYGAFHEIVNISNPNANLHDADIVGFLCESGDKFAIQRPITWPQEGDLLAIKNAGAYGFSMSSNYCLRPKPPEIMVTEKGCLQEIRRRETEEQLVGAT